MSILKDLKLHNQLFVPFRPTYNFLESVERSLSFLKSILFTIYKVKFKKSVKGKRQAFGASVEITDKCNAGCEHCYVYNKDWDQHKRLAGYLQLDKQQHKVAESKVIDIFTKLKKDGIIHVTLVGGEPLLSPQLIFEAGRLFPVVWVVTNGVIRPPQKFPHSIVLHVSIDGPPEYHNKLRDPLGFYSKHQYGNLTGMYASIVKNINQSERGAFVHTTLTPESLDLFPEAIDNFISDIQKLRGVIVSGAAVSSKDDLGFLSISDRARIGRMIEQAASKYGWKLFPFNTPRVNQFLFDERYRILTPSQCVVARRVDSYAFDGNLVGKCVLRDETDCSSCVCNITGLMRGVSRLDWQTITGLYQACLG
jgi:uncharacterized Fe-S cluster-containing radical SAM superfamily protein